MSCITNKIFPIKTKQDYYNFSTAHKFWEKMGKYIIFLMTLHTEEHHTTFTVTLFS